MGYKRQGKEEYVGRIITPVVVVVYGIIIAILANIVCWYFRSRNGNKYDFSPVPFNERDNSNGLVDDIEISSSVELSTYKDTKDDNAPCPDPSSKEALPSPSVNFEVLHGRPDVTEILEDLQDGISPALFCCVPANLAEKLCIAVNEKSRSSGPYIPVYRESFEI